MELDFWHQRWESGKTAFHQTGLNPYLGYFYGEKGPARDNRDALRVFVPLCGKSFDLHWLAQNAYDVIGLECSPIAISEFFESQQLAFKSFESGKFTKYKATAESSDISSLEVLQGDIFDLQAEELGNVTDIFDRASLIALPEDMRVKYVQKMADLQQPGTRTLLITMTYPQHEMNGPPFSVDEQEVQGLYAKDFMIEKLLTKNILPDEQRFQEKGLTSLIETAYKLKRK